MNVINREYNAPLAPSVKLSVQARMNALQLGDSHARACGAAQSATAREASRASAIQPDLTINAFSVAFAP